MDEQVRLRRVLIHMTYFTLILTSGFVMWLFYVTFYPFEVVKLHRFNADSVATAGGQLNYVLDFEKKLDYKAEIKYYLVDGFIQELEVPVAYRTVGQHTLNKTLTIPKYTVKTAHRLRITLDYEIVPWRHIFYSWESTEFTIK